MNLPSALGAEDLQRVRQILKESWRVAVQEHGTPAPEAAIVSRTLREIEQHAPEAWAVRTIVALALDGMRRTNAEAAARAPGQQHGFRDPTWLATLSGVPQALAALAAAGYSWASEPLLQLAGLGLATTLEHLVAEIAAEERAVGPDTWGALEEEMRARQTFLAALQRLHQVIPDAATPAEALARANIRWDPNTESVNVLAERVEEFLLRARRAVVE